MKWVGIALLVLALLAAAVVGGYLRYMSRSGSDPAFFESEIQAFLDADRAAPPAPGEIVFYGSSSIRFWSSLAQDMAPLAVVNRGFGGAHLSHLIHNASRVVIPRAPRAVVVYAGDNDIGAGKSAETVAADFDALVGLLRASLPELDVYFLSIKPSRLRWALWPEMARANEAIRLRAEADPRVHFIDVGQVLLGPDGTPEKRFFRFDGLHLSAAGYAAWTSVVAPILTQAHGPGRAGERLR
ncbi:MAG: SGNH/GDSL hydrolase family protein [Myxococcota bacterium]